MLRGDQEWSWPAAPLGSRKVHASIRGRFSRHATYPRARAGMGVRIGSAPPATAPSSELKDRASRLPQPGAASTSLEGTYGRELVHRMVAHLLHLLGSFGFVGPAKVAEGLDVMLADPDAMLGATFAAFDANGDGAIDATDLATTLSLARPFFGVPHAELVAKFDAVLRGAGGPRGPKARHGIRRSDLDSVLMYTPALEAWTLTPMRATALWLHSTELPSRKQSEPTTAGNQTKRTSPQRRRQRKRQQLQEQHQQQKQRRQ